MRTGIGTTNESDVIFEWYHREAGSTFIPYELLQLAWDECIELQGTTKAEWIRFALQEVERHERVEVLAVQNNTIVGSCVVVQELRDIHVKKCLVVMLNYVRPECRNTGVVRGLLRTINTLARSTNNNIVLYTHRLGPYKYETTYRRIPNG